MRCTSAPSNNCGDQNQLSFQLTVTKYALPCHCTLLRKPYRAAETVVAVLVFNLVSVATCQTRASGAGIVW